MILNFLSLPLFYRIIIALCFSFLFFFIGGERFVKWLKKKKMVDHFRDYSPPTHLSKKGTPSGGGIFILLSAGICWFLFADFSSKYLLIVILSTFLFGLAGLVDDLVKKKNKNSKGLSIRLKLSLQVIFTFLIFLFFFLSNFHFKSDIKLPFTGYTIESGFFYTAVFFIFILGFANAVNLTDGLDGLVAGCMIAPSIFFAVISLIQSNAYLASLFKMPHLPEMKELSVFWVALLGSIGGFLRYNRYPARMFMGGVGAEALGAACGISALVLKVEAFFLIAGGIFLAEAVSVVTQV
ncbi:phospho-N-acetylmuramoyl-pentapeptide-transferase, partial [Candidatus Aerophobetes bacterium]|nr:phospho-N-acetylmuramoyl-pentapeptide-transferase [Candidatus Aerophobetes bacterium]